MANPTNQTNTTIPEETYNILKEIKEKKGCTFDELLDQLCELDFKYNYIEKVQYYDLYYKDSVFSFTITFKKENMVFTYETLYGKYTNSISEWGLYDNIRKEFFTFIKEPFARCMFENMPAGLLFKDFYICKSPRRV